MTKLTAKEKAIRHAHMDLMRCATCGEQRWKHYYNSNTCIFKTPTGAGAVTHVGLAKP